MLQYQLVYYSDASKDFSEEELVELLNKAIKNNKSLGITGCLLYGNRRFIQLLEGPEASVRALYQKISTDPRHSNVMQVMEMTVNNKLFPDWSMGFKHVGNISNKIDGYTDVSKWIYSEFVTDASTAKEKVFNFAVRNKLMESQVLPK
ncbi:BLUF domain-containing protein [Catenovulum maritimum]|uniref:BLUF domain-containing protein n=1 Tax=Catenovulum maritimum TaxID=1513271 RepID=UPI00065F71A3|nr:BLUF domain-containing protein [Catenovulum maritimum]